MSAANSCKYIIRTSLIDAAGVLTGGTRLLPYSPSYVKLDSAGLLAASGIGTVFLSSIWSQNLDNRLIVFREPMISTAS